MDDLTYVPVGSDRFRAQLMAEACLAAGLEVELLTADDSGTFPGYGMVQPHRLLVRSDDLQQVIALVEKSGNANHPDPSIPD